MWKTREWQSSMFRAYNNITVFRGKSILFFLSWKLGLASKFAQRTPLRPGVRWYYSDAIMSAIVSQSSGVSIVYSTVCSGADQRKHQSTASLAFVRGIHRSPVNSQHKGPVTRKMIPFDEVIISWVSLRSGAAMKSLGDFFAVIWTESILSWLVELNTKLLTVERLNAKLLTGFKIQDVLPGSISGHRFQQAQDTFSKLWH